MKKEKSNYQMDWCQNWTVCLYLKRPESLLFRPQPSHGAHRLRAETSKREMGPRKGRGLVQRSGTEIPKPPALLERTRKRGAVPEDEVLTHFRPL